MGHFQTLPTKPAANEPSYPISAAGLGSPTQGSRPHQGNDRQMGLLTSHRAPQPDSLQGAVSESPSLHSFPLREEQTDCSDPPETGQAPFPHITSADLKENHT